MSDKLVIAMTSSKGVTLKTKGKYCDKNIMVVPQIEGENICGAVDFNNIPVVTNIDNPTETDLTFVRYKGEVHILVKE